MHIKPPQSVVCSDSEAALLALRDEMSAALYRIENVVCHVEFLLIPGHSGFEGNGMSGKLAKESLCKQTAEKFALQWQKEWTKEQKGRHFFLSTAKDYVVLIRLKLGHCGLAS